MPIKISYKLPLHKDISLGDNREHIIKQFSNLGLLYDKYPLIWTEKDNFNKAFQTEFEYLDDKKKKEKINLKHQFLTEIISNFDNTQSENCLKELSTRQHATMQGLQNWDWHVESFEAITVSRLIIGLGGTSVIETGITLHPLYGFPYLPASGLKGLARAYAEIAADPKPEKEELKEFFGSKSKDTADAANNQQGKVFFMDGLPAEFPKLDLDIMNPHYSEYYQGDKPPADYLNPVPVTFLAVALGQRFSFGVYSRDTGLLGKARQWLIGGLTELGAGGKTNVGYGYFRVDSSAVTQTKKEPGAVKEDNSMTARLKSVKNHQTFIHFVKGIEQDEIEDLQGISFKGMESIINIGLVGVLESSEVPAEIKKTIAEKMLEICKQPDKKYPEKFKKYRKLLSMAGENE